MCKFSVGTMAGFLIDGSNFRRRYLHKVLGTLILQQAHELTDKEAVKSLPFNILWHSALHISNKSDSLKYMCPKTL